MNRDRRYHRMQRCRAIHRKIGILRRIGGEQYVLAWSHGKTGRFAKGKIHCSCPMCRSKSYDEEHIRDKRMKQAADEQLHNID